MTDPQNTPQPPAYQTPGYPAAPPAAPAYDANGYAAAPAGPVPGKTMGIVAFVLSFFFQLLALILGIVALVQSKKAGRSNGFALAAIIISVVLMIVGAILIVAFVIPTFSAAATCAADPNAIVTLWGVEVPCSQVTTGY